MVQFLTILKLMFQLLPMIADAVKAIEAMFPSGGAGADKLAVLRSTLESAYKVGGDLQMSFEQVWSAAKPMVDAVVALYNKTGEFKKS